MKVETTSLISVADTDTVKVRSKGRAKRLFAGDVDRVTGEVYEPSINENLDILCTKFTSGDILFHKMGFRIGRVGLATFDGNAENEFMTIKAFGISCYYLLLALRSVSVPRHCPLRDCQT